MKKERRRKIKQKKENELLFFNTSKIEELPLHPSRKKLPLSNDFSRKRESSIQCILQELLLVCT